MAVLGALATIASAGIGIAGAISQGNAAQAAGQFEAQQHDAQAKEDVAAAQRTAAEKSRATQYTMSREQALAAASGAGVDTPSILNIYGDTAGRGDYLARSADFVGQDQARAQQDQAKAALFKGNAAEQGSIFAGIGSGLSGLSKVKANDFGFG